MVKKLCPGCRQYSYSAKTEGRWVCPTCQLDLTLMPVLWLGEVLTLPEQ